MTGLKKSDEGPTRQRSCGRSLHDTAHKQQEPSKKPKVRSQWCDCAWLAEKQPHPHHSGARALVAYAYTYKIMILRSIKTSYLSMIIFDIVPISRTLHTESTLRIYWFFHHTFLSRTVATPRQTNRAILRRLTSTTIINLLLKLFVVLSSLRCLVPVRFRIIVTISSHYNISRLYYPRTSTRNKRKKVFFR